ncbi:CCR4-NOT transcription complex subunit 1-like isoform X11 [Littorina saxatilis]|uniref:CCR4-NOT transcription complex subunit 1-like isoform X11 n=1 Tax=Littorina saxatilis TaxID=31220 RepID=UPI0038B4D642
MNLDSLSFALAEISYSVANLTKKNYKASVAEINHLVLQHGAEADGHLFRCLLSHIDFSGDGKSSGKDLYQIQYLTTDNSHFLGRPNFISILCNAVDNPLHHQKTLKPSTQLLSQLSKVLKLNRVQEVVYAFALLHSSNSDSVQYATQFLKQKIPDLIHSYVDADTAVTGRQEGGLQDAGVEALHLLLSHLLRGRDTYGIGKEQKEALLKTLRRDFPRERVPAILSFLLYPETEDIPVNQLSTLNNMPSSMMDSSLAELLMEAGYGCTSSKDECRSVMVGVRELSPLAVARALGMIARTPVGLSDQQQTSGWGEKTETPGVTTWNVDIFVQTIRDLSPSLDWKEVVGQLDHQGFLVTGKKGLRLLVQGLLRGLQLSNESFPVQYIFRPWSNTEGQLSFIIQSLRFYDIFCFADYLVDVVVSDILKSTPSDDDREVAVWKSLNLVETLLRLSEAGHYQPVLEAFKLPVTKCPDILVLALLQTTPTWNTLKQELISNLMPIFLGSHPNSAAILHYAWHYQSHSSTIRTLIMHSMAEWYMRGDVHDQMRLSRILDVAQDLKALSMLLNATPYAFVVDLACLASRREYLKLDKWLTDKIADHKEPFISACVLFLKRRCPQLVGVGKEEPQAKSQQLPPETVATMLNCLKQFAGYFLSRSHVSQELQEAITTMYTNATVYLSKLRVAPNPVGPPGPVGPKPPNFPQGMRMFKMDPMSMAGVMGQQQPVSAVGSGAPGPPGPPGGGGFPQSMPPLNPSTPGSPARSFPGMGTQPNGGNPGFNPMPSLNSQFQSTPPDTGKFLPAFQQTIDAGWNPIGSHFQNMGFQNSSTMNASRTNPINSLASLSIQAVRPPAPNEQRLGNRAGAVSSGSSGPGPGGGTGPGPGPGGGGGGNPGPPGDMSSLFPEMQQSFSKEVEDQANSYFQQIYNHPPASNMSIEQVLSMLKKFKDSNNKMEKDVFQCMLRNLFEEYRFFPQYPDRELQTTAVLFGGIIDQGIVTYWTLGIALRYILDGLRKPHGSKMYLFGITALDRFKNRLKEYPQYCQHVSAIPHFREFPQHIIEFVEYGARSQEPPQPHPDAARSQTPSMPLGGGGPPLPMNPARSAPMDVGLGHGMGMPTSMAASVSAPPPSIQTPTSSTSQPPPPPPPSTPSAGPPGSTTSGGSRGPAFPKPSIATATNIDTLLAGQGKEEISVPPESLQDKVFFIFNNLSLANMVQKGEELKDHMGDDYVPWVSQYLVMKRASIEPNFHTLYSSFIDVLKIYQLYNMVVKETFRNIKVLLRSDKGVANFSDRTLLKNLGHWLGMITLAKNKPILKNDVDLKALVYEAYQKGAQELLYVVPFTAKVLESCAKSKVFCVPSPWTMAIMNVLAELHQEPDLKLNLKFEIEVLCKTLGLDVNDLKPATYLKDPSRMVHLEVQYLSRPQLPPPPQPKESEEQVVIPPPPPSLGLPFPMNQVPVSMPPPVPLPPMHGGLGVGGAGLPPSMPPPTVPQHQHPYPTFDSINTNIATIQQQIQFNEKHPFMQGNMFLIQHVRPTIERTIQDLITPVVDRSIKIALTTCEQIVKKDFALEPDEGRMRNAAHCMMRNITCGLALITAREPILMQITNNLKSAFSSKFNINNQPPKEMLDQACSAIAGDVVDVCTAFIQKTAVERAVPEMDKRLANEFELRKVARAENRRYCDPACLTYQAERMPEQIRMKVGSVTSQQLAVYEEFARNLPGFMQLDYMGGPAKPMHQPPPQQQQQQQQQPPPMMPQQMQQQPPPNVPPPPQYAPDEVSLIFERIVRDLEQHLQVISIMPNSPMTAQLHSLLETAIQTRNAREPRAATILLQKAVEGLLEHYIPSAITSDQQELLLRFRECHLMVLKGLADARALGPGWAPKEVTRCLIMSGREESKYNLEAVETLIRSGLISQTQFDVYLTSVLETGSSPAVSFVMQVMQRICSDDKNSPHNFTENDFPQTVDALNTIAARPRQSPEGPNVSLRLENLMTNLRVPGGDSVSNSVRNNAATMMQSGISQAREFDDPPGLHEKAEYLLREWVNMYHSPAAGRDSTKAFTCFVQQMHQQGILKTDDLITRFFRLCTEMCVDLCYRALSEQSHSPTLVRAKCFHTLDAFVRLIALLVKHSGDNANTVTKINLLNKVLGIVAGVLLQDHEVRYTDFQQLPYHRIFIMLFIELNAPEPILEGINYQVLAAFCQAFHILRPSKAPAFAFAWMELISHRVFIGRLLALTPGQRGWAMYAQLLMDLFKFLAPFLRNADLTKSTQLLYKGTLRVLLVLLHDFPEFLCDYHYTFCDVIPPNCIQMRNLILSAFPRNMRLPDPFTPNLKVDSLPDITQAPRILSNYVNIIQPASFKKDLDSYLKTRSPITFLSDLKSNLQSTDAGCHYNIQLVNALVLYVGTQAIQYVNNKSQTPSMNTIAPSTHMDIFQNLAVNLDTEGRYLFLTAISNQLRYPNSHTHYFSCCLLYLFAQAHTEAVQEQITRVLLERLIVNRPHPWGLLITFIELIKNPSFKFWNHDFVHCAPEIEKLFESVARSCTLKGNMREPETTEVH